MTEVYKIEIIKMLGKSVFGSDFEQDDAKIVLKRCKKLKKGIHWKCGNLYGSIDKLTIMIRICAQHKLIVSFNVALQRSRA